MWVANGDKEKRWDNAMQKAESIYKVTKDFKWEVEPPKFRKENSSGEIRLQIPANFILRGKTKEDISNLINLADEFEIYNRYIWIMRWNNVYSWDETIHIEEIDEYDDEEDE